MKDSIIYSILFLFSVISEAKSEPLYPIDTITYWHIYLGDSLKMKSNIIVADIAPDNFRFTVKKKSKKEDIIIYWGGCILKSDHLVELIDTEGKVVRKFHEEDNYMLKMTSSLVYRLPKGFYKIMWITPKKNITLGGLQIE